MYQPRRSQPQGSQEPQESQEPHEPQQQPQDNHTTGNGPLEVTHTVVDDTAVMVTLRAPKQVSRAPISVVLVLDSSLSMNTTDEQEPRVTRLDIVKHAVKTIAHMLNQHDRLGIVSFSDTARVVCGMHHMEGHTRDYAIDAVMSIKATGGSYLWAGIQTGLDLLADDGKYGAKNNRNSNNNNNYLIVLSGSEPTVHTERGIPHELDKWIGAHKTFGFSLRTLVFGYDNLPSELLAIMSHKVSSGTFTYIPNTGMVGTVMISLMASIFATVYTNIIIVMCRTSDGNVLKSETVAMLQSQQTRNMLIRVCYVPRDRDALTVSCIYTDVLDTSQHGPCCVNSFVKPMDHQSDQLLVATSNHYTLIRELQHAIDNHIPYIGMHTIARIRAVSSSIDPAAVPLALDMQGQVCLALEDSNIDRWGVHYMRSLLDAHTNKVCNNFKDVGVRQYANPEFESYTDAGATIFDSMPLMGTAAAAETTDVVKTIKQMRIMKLIAVQTPVATGLSARREPIMARALNSHNNQDNPCIYPDAMVAMRNGTKKRVIDLQLGDEVKTIGDGDWSLSGKKWSKVLCVVVTKLDTSVYKQKMVTLPGGLKITNWHPVCGKNRVWKFPAKLSCAVDYDPSGKIDCVVSLVLEYGHDGFLADGVWVASLGHSCDLNGYTQSRGDNAWNALMHPFFSTKARLQLMQLPGWSKGRITFDSGPLLRDYNTELVCGFNPNKVIHPAVECVQSTNEAVVEQLNSISWNFRYSIASLVGSVYDMAHRIRNYVLQRAYPD